MRRRSLGERLLDLVGYAFAGVMAVLVRFKWFQRWLDEGDQDFSEKSKRKE